MVNYPVRDISSQFSALGDPNRLAMVRQMSLGEVTVGDLAANLKITMPATLKHLAILERAGVATSSKIGRERKCRLEEIFLNDIDSWVTETRQAWNFRLDRLAALLEGSKESNL